MSTGSTRQPSTIGPGPPIPTQWRVWPLRQSTFRSALVLLGLLAAWGTVRLATGQMHLAMLAMAALGLSLWRFFLPVGFELNARGVEQSVLGRHRLVRWAAVGRYEVCRSGVLLLPHRDRRPIDVFRGLYLPWGEHRDEVLAHVRYHLDVHV